MGQGARKCFKTRRRTKSHSPCLHAGRQTHSHLGTRELLQPQHVYTVQSILEGPPQSRPTQCPGETSSGHETLPSDKATPHSRSRTPGAAGARGHLTQRTHSQCRNGMPTRETTLETLPNTEKCACYSDHATLHGRLQLCVMCPRRQGKPSGEPLKHSFLCLVGQAIFKLFTRTGICPPDWKWLVLCCY